ncbi:MAG: NAD(P)/FAD-dependent oxidoreductase [Bacteroidales bacterium]|nr:NAD(P)/FAD-dependent oxidoreductase [Bacteroidales bacterium]
MKSGIVVIGGGASGLMAAYYAARTLVQAGRDAQVTVLEKMPRAARKVMITGKGRCNFTNVKEWNDFSGHIRSNPNFVKSAFYHLPPEVLLDWFEGFGMPTVVERGDRAFPASHHASDVVDTLVGACHSLGVKIELEAEVESVSNAPSGAEERFVVRLCDGREWKCARLIVATGGLSYPSTGSTGDGLRWAEGLGHRIVPTFPSLTALVPKGYKQQEDKDLHIDRGTPLGELGEKLCGVSLKNIQATLLVEGTEADSEFGDVDFTDGGLEGPVGFQLSRKAVKAMVNGSRVGVVLDLKPGVSLTDLTVRVKELWSEIEKDPRSRRLREKERCRILLGKLMPWDLIPGFTAMQPGIITLERRSRTETKVWVNLVSIAKALKAWKFDIAGYVGYERCVVTAGGVSTDEFVAKTMESRLLPGLHLCGEVLDIDADTGGYNLQLAFATGALAGASAAKSFIADCN